MLWNVLQSCTMFLGLSCNVLHCHAMSDNVQQCNVLQRTVEPLLTDTPFKRTLICSPKYH